MMHTWRGDRCANCGARRDWPIAAEPCRATARVITGCRARRRAASARFQAHLAAIRPKRARAVELRAQGWTYRQIAAELGTYEQEARNWVVRRERGAKS